MMTLYSVTQRAIGRIARPTLLRLTTPLLRVLSALHVAPNAISLLQIPLGVLMVLVIHTSRPAVIGLMLICFALDGLDGLFARYSNQTSAYGALVDQLADQIREVLTVAAVAQVGALSAVVATLYGVLYPLSNVALYVLNLHGGKPRPTFKSVVTFYPFLLIYLLGGANWLEVAGWLTLLAMSLTIADCTAQLRRLMPPSSAL